MRHGETLGFYSPARKRSRKAELESMRVAAKDLDEMIAAWGAGEDEMMEEYKELRRAARENKRNSWAVTSKVASSGPIVPAISKQQRTSRTK